MITRLRMIEKYFLLRMLAMYGGVLILLAYSS